MKPARSQPSSVVTKRQVDALPVLERNFLVLAQLLPGSSPITSTTNRFAVTKFGGVGDQRSGYTTLIDGGDVDDAQWGSPTINVSQDAVQEFKVFRSQFDAQYGHALNAVVTVATRSGTNRFAGSGFYFGRDDTLNARNPFATSKPPFDEHRIGASLGGPVLRDRSHSLPCTRRTLSTTSASLRCRRAIRWRQPRTASSRRDPTIGWPRSGSITALRRSRHCRCATTTRTNVAAHQHQPRV